MRGALDCVINPLAKRRLHEALFEHTRNYASKHGGAAFAMPRDLAVCHEVGHAVIGAVDGVTVARVEVFGKSVIKSLEEKHGRPLTRPERRRLVRNGYDPAGKHGTVHHVGHEPVSGDEAGTYFDPQSVETSIFAITSA